MKVADFDNVLAKHVKTVILPQLTNPWTMFKLGGMVGARLLSAECMRKQLEGVGILDGDEINVETLRDFVAGGFEAVPEVSLLGMRFNRSDAESLLRAFGMEWQVKGKEPA